MGVDTKIIMSNTVFNFSIKHKVQIHQTFLVEGHIQTECETVDSIIERKLVKKEFKLLSEFVRLTKESRKNPEPYEAKMLSHEEFFDL